MISKFQNIKNSDGQYIKMGVSAHLQQKLGLGSTFRESWDPLHR